MFKMKVIVYLMLFVTLNCVYCEPYKTVVTHNGAVRGIHKFTLFKNVSYYAFLGIPYAEKPIDELRFKAPIPVDSWKPNVIDAFEYGASCIQQSFAIGNSGPESEDCLYLNIFVPAKIKSNKKLAVIFFIHGGGFAEGSGNSYFYGPDFLLEQGVILVTINYRLGIFGFMSLHSKQYSGNMGLKDQQLALKWINKNIPKFGGDRKRITLIGQSAGGVSVHYHVLFKESRKLFRRAICLSGSAFQHYAYLDEKSHLQKMYHFAQQVNASIQHFHELIDFLRNVPTQTIVNLTSQTLFDRTLIFDWAPAIEKKSAIRPILLETPEEMYQKNCEIDVGMMFGYTNYECLSLVWSDIANSTRLNNFLRNFSLVIPLHQLKPQFELRSYRKILTKIQKQKQNIPSNIHSTINFPSMGNWTIFRCNSIDSVYEEIIKTKHNDSISKITYDTIRYMTEMCGNFAKYGSPTVDGDPVKGFRRVRGNKIHFLNITNNALIPGLSPNNESIKFWEKILFKAEQLIR